MATDPVAPDRPFPGARSQVPGVRFEDRVATQHDSVGERRLPLESSPVPSEQGWRVRLPVRAEHIGIGKQVVVYERVLVRRHEIEEQARLAATVRREELTVDVDRNQRPLGPQRDDDER